jgi:hypothetical protein
MRVLIILILIEWSDRTGHGWNADRLALLSRTSQISKNVLPAV